MFCTNCGVQLPDKARFCNQCGTPVASPGTVSVNPAGNSSLGSYSQQETIVTGDVCRTCGKSVAGLRISCPSCGALLTPPATHTILPGEFEHPAMQQMNQLLRQSTTLNSMATMLSKKVGKPWYESCFTSVRTSETQYPKVFELTAIAARRIGINSLPAVHIEADRVYQSATYGSMQDAFINIGTLIPRLLNDQELLFILGHELGHLLSGHALWTTVSMFLVGQHKSTIMSEGILKYISNPLKVVEQGVESLVSNWMRVAEYTADRAALLVVGDYATARRALFLLYFKSRRELQEIDLEEWEKSQEEQDVSGQKISQIASPTPYLGPRLKELATFYRSPQYENLRQRIESGCGITLTDLFNEKGALKTTGPITRQESQQNRVSSAMPRAALITGSCPHCGAGMRISLEQSGQADPITVTCQSCRGTFFLNTSKILSNKLSVPENRRAAPRTALQTATANGKRNNHEQQYRTQSSLPQHDDGKPVIRGSCPSCSAAFSVSLEKLGTSGRTVLQCSTCSRKFTLDLTRLSHGATSVNGT